MPYISVRLPTHRLQHVTLLRSFGRFLDECKKDPHGAQRYFSEAEKIEETNEADNEDDTAVSDRRDAVIVISSSGVIKIANKNAHALFGFKGDYLLGKNVSLLMPPPCAPPCWRTLEMYCFSAQCENTFAVLRP